MHHELLFFAEREFACPCGACSRSIRHMDPAMLVALDAARRLAGIPFVLTSAVRCEKHNGRVGGVDSSAHIDGYAVDIATPSSAVRSKILTALQAVGFTRFGIGQTYLHVDLDPGKPAGVVWLYGTAEATDGTDGR